MNPVLADTPRMFPHVCLDGRQDGPVVLLCNPPDGFWRGSIYASRSMIRDSARLVPAVVEELAGEIGWVSAADHAAELSKRDLRIADLEGRLAELEPVERALFDAARRFEAVEA